MSAVITVLGSCCYFASSMYALCRVERTFNGEDIEQTHSNKYKWLQMNITISFYYSLHHWSKVTQLMEDFMISERKFQTAYSNSLHDLIFVSAKTEKAKCIYKRFWFPGSRSYERVLRDHNQQLSLLHFSFQQRIKDGLQPWYLLRFKIMCWRPLTLMWGYFCLIKLCS